MVNSSMSYDDGQNASNSDQLGLKCYNESCTESAVNFCFSHRAVMCVKCTQKSHSKCLVETLKSTLETKDLMKYLKILVSKLKSICGDPMAERMIKQNVDELKPYFFEFNIHKARFSKMLKEKSEDDTIWTVMFTRFQNFHKALKGEKSYSKVIEFEFEQNVCKVLQLQNQIESDCSQSPSSHGSSKNVARFSSKSPIVNSKFKKFIVIDNTKQGHISRSETKHVIKIPKRKISMIHRRPKKLDTEDDRPSTPIFNLNQNQGQVSDQSSVERANKSKFRVVSGNETKMLVTPEKPRKPVQFMVRPISNKPSQVTHSGQSAS